MRLLEHFSFGNMAPPLPLVLKKFLAPRKRYANLVALLLYFGHYETFFK